MKKTLILPLLMLTWLLPAQRDPQWLMPLYFRDANGDRDTVYFGYDPEAGIHFEDADTLLGEDWIRIDTSRFNVYLLSYPGYPGGIGPLITDTVRKVDIRVTLVGAYIGFCKGKMPISMKWVDSLLYAPSCPFPDLSPRPRARIDLNCSPQETAYLWCGPADGDPLSLTNYPAPEIHYPVMDSMFFNGSGYYSPAESIGNLSLNLVAHNHSYVSLENTKSQNICIYPNPFTNELSIEYPGSAEYTVQIYSITGEILYQTSSKRSSFTIHLDHLRRGFYLISVHSNRIIYIQKLTKSE
jgi:hypothetical protein